MKRNEEKNRILKFSRYIQTYLPTKGQTLLQRCEDASKNTNLESFYQESPLFRYSAIHLPIHPFRFIHSNTYFPSLLPHELQSSIASPHCHLVLESPIQYSTIHPPISVASQGLNAPDFVFWLHHFITPLSTSRSLLPFSGLISHCLSLLGTQIPIFVAP